MSVGKREESDIYDWYQYVIIWRYYRFMFIITLMWNLLILRYYYYSPWNGIDIESGSMNFFVGNDDAEIY